MAEKIQNRQVKCAITGEMGPACDFYRDKSGKYYKSEQVYRDYRAEVEAYKEVKHIIDVELIGYNPNLPYNSFTPYNLKKLKGYSNRVILETVKRNKNQILSAVRKKEFRDSSAKCSYIFAIIKGRLQDVKRTLEREDKMRERTKAKLEANSLADELMVAALNTESTAPPVKQRKKDISAFLSEEELQ